MANGRYDYDNAEQVQRVPKKADVILKRQQEMALKQDDAIAKVNAANARIDEVMAELAKVREESAEALRRNEELFGTVGESVAALRRELRYLAAQNESIYNSVSDKFEKLGGEVNGLSSPVHPAEDEAALTEAVAAEPVPFNAEIDYDTLAAKVAERIEVPAPQVVSDGVPVQTIVRENAEIDYDVLVDKIVARLPMQEGAAQPVQAEIDYDTLAARVAERIALPAAAAAPVYEPVQVSAEIDYDALASKVAERIPAPQVVSDGTPVQTVVHESAEIDYETLAAKVAERIEVPAATVAAEPVQVSAEVDYDLIADKVISRIPVQEVISPDYIASRVAEQLIIPEAGNAQIDYDTLAEKVAERMPAPQLIAEAAPAAAVSENTEIDYEHLAELISEHMPVKETLVTAAGAEIDYEELAGKVAERISIPEAASTAVVANADIDEEELADRIALKIGAIQPDDYNIMVDEEGCASITKEITEKLDYELIASTVADKLRETLDLSGEDNGEQPDYEEMAARISENITVAGVNEDAIAEKAAAVLSNYLPEFDTDEIADKVATQVISALPAAEVDSEAVSNAVAEKLNERQQELDYDIVLDEDGLEKVSASVSENVTKTTEERFDTIDREIEEIKRMLAAGVLVAAPREDDIAPAEAYEEVYEEEAEEEQLVTVSDVIADEPEETVEEEVAEEVTEEVTEPEEAVEETLEEELAEEAEEEQPAEEPSAPIVIVTEQTVAEEEEADGDEDEAVEEFSYDELAGEGGVDFANMMRYNRSFIARIIQGTDEQKTYYGEVRNALLSYKKVNSNIAWGAERFHKGRETIARFKIRGKTLILYLALDPATHEYSVYHHKDVSDNKSVAGTPMMIKVKSPLGVKKAVRLIDEMLAARNGEKRNIPQRDYAAMYPYETIEELIEDGLVKDVKKDK